MVDLLNTSVIHAAASAFIHSLWIGMLIVSLLILFSHSGVLNDPRKRYKAHFIGLATLSYLTVVVFFIELNSGIEVSGGLTTYHVGEISGSRYSNTIGLDITWQKLVVLFWLLGMIAYGCAQALGFRKLWTTLKTTVRAPEEWEVRTRKLCKRMGITATVSLVTSDVTTVPFVFGVLRPLIVFPANYFTQLTPRELESILLHEIAHIAHSDFLFNLIQVTLESFLFFNPATWWLSRQIRIHREFCCDDRVWSNNTGNTYLRALYKAACLSTTPSKPAIALFNNKSELIMRVKRMSNGNEPTTSLRALVVAIIGLVCITGLFAFQLIDDSKNAGLKVVEATYPEPAFYLNNNNLEAPKLPQFYPIDLISRDATTAVLDTHPPSKRIHELQAQIEPVY